MSDGTMTRRELLRRGGDVGGLLALPLILPREAAASASRAAVADNSGLRVGDDIYQSIGVRPIINARGTYTIISGSVMLPEVRAALDAAAQHYVHLDELADAIGARLATLTGAEWGLVTSGCAAALTHATAACVAGGNPDLHVRIPNLAGFPRDEAIIPKHSRNVYDAAVRAVGLRVIEVETFAELQAAFGPRTAMVYLFAGPNADKSPVSLQAIAPVAKANGVPILVDAAAEVLTVPNVHLQNGATLVAYSGGKCIRGPQTAGLLLGRKDLVRAAWVHSAPHHGFSRGMKVGKEEADGDAHGRRDVDEARPRRRVGEVDVVAEPHRRPREDRGRRAHRNHAAGRALQQDAVAQSDVGQEQARRLRRPRRAHAARRRAARGPLRAARRLAVGHRRLHYALHAASRRRADRGRPARGRAGAPAAADAASSPTTPAADLERALGRADRVRRWSHRTMPCTCGNRAATSTVHTPAISCLAISPARSTATPCASTAATTKHTATR